MHPFPTVTATGCDPAEQCSSSAGPAHTVSASPSILPPAVTLTTLTILLDPEEPSQIPNAVPCRSGTRSTITEDAFSGRSLRRRPGSGFAVFLLDKRECAPTI
jgi:hypothetical protein